MSAADRKWNLNFYSNQPKRPRKRPKKVNEGRDLDHVPHSARIFWIQNGGVWLASRLEIYDVTHGWVFGKNEPKVNQGTRVCKWVTFCNLNISLPSLGWEIILGFPDIGGCLRVLIVSIFCACAIPIFDFRWLMFRSSCKRICLGSDFGFGKYQVRMASFLYAWCVAKRECIRSMLKNKTIDDCRRVKEKLVFTTEKQGVVVRVLHGWKRILTRWIFRLATEFWQARLHHKASRTVKKTSKLNLQK